MFAAGRYHDVTRIMDAALETSGNDYNVYVPILNLVPEDARAHILLAADYAAVGRVEEATRATNLAMALRPNHAFMPRSFCLLGKGPRR